MTVKKTLIALGVMSTLGVSAGAIAGPASHPVSVSDSTPWLSFQDRQSAQMHSSIGATSSNAGGSLGASVGDSDFYTVSLVPVSDDWDYYVLSPMSSDDLYRSAADEDFYVLSPGSYSVVTLYTFDDDASMM